VPWVLLIVAIAVLSLAVLGLVGFALYRRVRVLMRAVGQASSTVGEMSAGLTLAQAPSRAAAK
jgi:hypothetical protein